MSFALYENIDIKKTRKPHPCHLCYQDIPKGFACIYEKGIWDGDFFSRYSHNECAKKWIEINDGDSGDDNWALLDDLEEFHNQPMNFKQWKEHIGGLYGLRDNDNQKNQ